MTLTEQLEDIHHRAMQVKPPAMELYALLLYELMPLIRSSKNLSELFQAQIDGEKTSYLSVNACMEDEEYRMSILNGGDAQMLGFFLNAVDEVCRQMITFSDIPEEAKTISRVGRPSSLTFNDKTGVFHYGKKPNKHSCIITPNTRMFILSQKMMHLSVQLGDSKSWVDLYEDIYGVEPTTNEDWKKIDQLVRLVNRKLSIAHIPAALKFAGGSKGFIARVL